MNRRRITALLGAAVLAMSALAGCGGAREGAAPAPAAKEEAAVEESTEVATEDAVYLFPGLEHRTGKRLKPCLRNSLRQQAMFLSSRLQTRRFLSNSSRSSL